MSVKSSLRALWKFINSHKTKITGALMIAMGSLQANASSVQAVLSPRQFAVFTIVAGTVVAILGFLNSATAKKAEPPQ